jgi:hypothetical protein
MRETIVRIFEGKPDKRFTLKEIYKSIPAHCELSEDQKELDGKYLQPRLQHEARLE